MKLTKYFLCLIVSGGVIELANLRPHIIET